MAEYIFKQITYFVAFIGIMCCAISLLVGNFIPVFIDIAKIIGLLTTAICALFYVFSRKSVLCVILFSFSLIIIIVFGVLEITF